MSKKPEWRRIVNELLSDEMQKWHWYRSGMYAKAVCGNAPVIGLPYCTDDNSAEKPVGLANVCPECLAVFDARQAKTG